MSVDELIALKPFSTRLFPKEARKSSSTLAGGYVSPFRGRGIDFSEVRSYQPGDDIRSMDWRVTARTGKPHTKLYVEERERPVYLFVDFSASMHFGSRVAFKSVIASKVAALLAWSSVAHGDRIGCFLVNDKDHFELKAQSGRRGVTRVLSLLAEWSQRSPGEGITGHSGFSNTFLRAQRVIKPGSLIFLISDFQFFDAAHVHPLQNLARHCDLVSIQVRDPLEISAPPAGIYNITDGKYIRSLNFFSKTLLENFDKQRREQQSVLNKFCTRNGIKYISLASNEDLTSTLQHAFAERG